MKGLDLHTLQVVRHLLAGRLCSVRKNTKNIKQIIERDHVDALTSKVSYKRLLTLQDIMDISCRDADAINDILKDLIEKNEL